MLPIFSWSPRVGDDDDDNFNLPHGRQLDDSVLIDKPQALRGFGSAAYPAPPELADVDGGHGANQIVAAINYKSYFADVSGSPLAPISYIFGNSLGRASNALWTNLATRINLLRGYEGFDAFDFRAIAAGDPPRAWQLAERRKALALIGQSRSTYGSTEYFIFPGFPFLGLYSSANGDVNPSPNTVSIGLGSGTSQGGSARHFRLFPWMIDWAAASIEVVVFDSTGSFTGELWLSNTSDKFYGSSGVFSAGYDNLVGTWSGNGTYTFDLSPYAAILKDDTHVFASFVLTTTEQRTAGAGPGVYRAALTLIRDYGA